MYKRQVYETPLTDEELIEETKKTAYPELQQIFHKNDGTGANYYRIPALLTLKSGTVISAADARFGGTHDLSLIHISSRFILSAYVGFY